MVAPYYNSASCRIHAPPNSLANDAERVSKIAWTPARLTGRLGLHFDVARNSRDSPPLHSLFPELQTPVRALAYRGLFSPQILEAD